MRLKQYLIEGKQQINISISDIQSLIEKDCKPFLNIIGGFDNNHLYRGYKLQDYDHLYKIVPRKNRKPSDTPVEVQKEFDIEFKKKFNIKARSEAVFVTGDALTADIYGTVFVVFPIGKFTYLWSPQIKDFTKYLFKYYYSGATLNTLYKILDMFGLIKIEMTNDEIKSVINKYTNKGLKEYNNNKTENEMMLFCNEYYMMSDILYKEILNGSYNET